MEICEVLHVNIVTQSQNSDTIPKIRKLPFTVKIYHLRPEIPHEKDFSGQFGRKKAVLPVSSLLQGAYGLRQVCLSVPTLVGRSGVEGHIEMELWPKELSDLQRSAEVLRGTAGEVLK